MLEKKHRNKLLSLFFFSFCFSTQVIAVAPKYPAVKNVYGNVWVTGKDGKRQLVSRSQVLREKALIETSPSAQVTINLDDQRTLILLGESELSLPIISWEEGQTPVLILKKGQLEWVQNSAGKLSYNIALNSDLFEFIAPPGHFIYAIDPQKALASVKVFEGSIEFSALNGEESVLVKAGETAGFQGVIDDGGISYDVLLKGRKIPKGKLTAITPIDPAELAKIALEKKKHLDQISWQQNQKKIAAEKAKRDGIICSAPAAKFNECSWVCLNNPKKETKKCLISQGKVSCVRQRCNANGDWAEKTELDAENASIQCKARPVVAPCDY